MRLWPPPGSPAEHAKHLEERLKLAANGCQTFALSLLVFTFVAPTFSPTGGRVGFATSLAAGVFAALLVVAAHVLLRYIPYSTEKASA